MPAAAQRHSTKYVLDNTHDNAERTTRNHVGVTDGTNKFEGYVRLMVPPDARGNCRSWGESQREGYGALPTTQSEEAMVQETEETNELQSVT